MSGIAQAGLTFGARKEAYDAFRISYAPQLFERIASVLPADGRRLAIDVGSGTGISTGPLLDLFERVIAVEPDARMAEKIEPRPNLSVVIARGEDYECAAGAADLVTSGTAFYWMDGPLMIGKMARWIRPEGAVAVFRYALPILPIAVQAIIEREFAERWNRFRHERLLDEDYSWRCFRESDAFAYKSKDLIANQTEMTAARFVGFFGSTSYVGAYLRTIEDPERYLGELEEEVRSVTDGQPFTADFPTELILASHRPL